MKNKIASILGLGDKFIDDFLNLIGKHPWDCWMKKANEHLDVYLQLFMVFSGLVGIIYNLAMFIRYEMPGGFYRMLLGAFIVLAFAFLLTPKTLALPRKLLSYDRKEEIRPEVLDILRLLFGLGGFVVAAICLLSAEVEAAIAAAIIGALMTIVTKNPAMLGYEACPPKNCLSEAVGLLMFPVRLVFVLMTPLIAIGSLVAFGYGFVAMCREGYDFGVCFAIPAGLTTIVPIVSYLIYICYYWSIDLVCGIASIPSKLDKLIPLPMKEAECPECHAISEVPGDTEEGRHIICPACSAKFNYHRAD